MDIYTEIKNYKPYNEQEEKDKEELLKWMDSGLDLWTRENGFAHWTASAWITDSTHAKILMAYHNIYRSWSWLGGHADGEHDLLKTAIKEVEEESGLKKLKLISDGIYSIEILTVDGHMKNGEYVSSHLHLNVTYLFEADPNEEVFVKRDENSAVCWFEKKKALEMSSEPWFVEHIYSKLNEKMK